MKTSVEIDDEHRVRLLELAAKRGDKDLAGVMAEAIETYLAVMDGDQERWRTALALRGSLSDEDAEELRAAVSRLREGWR